MNIQEYKDLITEGYKLFQAGDIPKLLDLYHDDAEWAGPESEYLPYAGCFHGKRGIAEFFSKLDATMQALHMQPKQMIAEGDTIVVIGDATWVARNTGVQFDNPWVHVFRVRDGKVAQFSSYHDNAPAEHAIRTDLQPGQDMAKPLHH